MAQVSLPYTLTAGQPENVNQLQADLDALVLGVNTIDTAQIASGAVTTAKIADAGVTADKLGATLAGQLGISTTATSRSVTVTQTAEISTTALSGSPTTVATSSELTTAANGILRITGWGEGKTANASTTMTLVIEVNNNGSWLNISGSTRGPTCLVFDSGAYSVIGVYPFVTSDSYKKIGFVQEIPFVSGGVESSTGKSQFRIRYGTSNTSYAAYLKNLTATMTYIAA